MDATRLPTIEEIRTLITVEVACAGGTVTDRAEPSGHLYLRATLPQVQEIRPGDALKGGVAARVTPQDVLICPYLFRQLCGNGAVVTMAGEAQRIERVDADCDCADARLALQTTVERCLAPETFTRLVSEMRPTLRRAAVLAVHFFPLLGRTREALDTRTWHEILVRFRREQDDSVFGLMNAITSVARDQSDPHMRWRLEDMGGAVPALLSQPDAPRNAQNQRSRAAERATGSPI